MERGRGGLAAKERMETSKMLNTWRVPTLSTVYPPPPSPHSDQEPEIRQVYSFPPDSLQLSQIPLIAKRCGEAGGNYRFRLLEGRTLSNYDQSFSLDYRGGSKWKWRPLRQWSCRTVRQVQTGASCHGLATKDTFLTV